jgi:hypothetical protein
MTISRLQPRPRGPRRGRRLVAACAVAVALAAARPAAAARLALEPDETGYCLVPLCLAGPRFVPCQFLDFPQVVIALVAGSHVTLRWPGAQPLRLFCAP